MGYILTFIGGSVFGMVATCVFVVSGKESRQEEKELEMNHTKQYID